MTNRSIKQSLAKQYWVSFVGFVVVFVVAGFLFTRATNAENVTLKTSGTPTHSTPSTKPSPSVFRFLAVGDTGSGVAFQQDVTNQMVAYHKAHPVKLVLHLGDIIYPYGEIDAYGESRYLKFYRPLMTDGVAFKTVLGNHDVIKGHVANLLKFYKMPGRYYAFKEGNVAFFAVDTNILDDKAQLAWLTHALADSQADKTVHWRIVFGHHPVFSTGAHGKELHTEVKTLKPLFEQYGVDLYLAGHDHDYERFNPVNGVEYVVSGGGGAYLRPFKLPENNTAVRQSVHHFLAFTVDNHTLALEAINKTGTVFDRLVIKK